MPPPCHHSPSTTPSPPPCEQEKWPLDHPLAAPLPPPPTPAALPRDAPWFGRTLHRHVLYNMERDLVNANYELTANMEKRQRQPSGDKVVYLETDLQSSTKLWEHHTDVMHKAIKTHHNLMRSLALEYFGWELATEGDAFLLAFHDTYDAVSFALTFQNELMDQDWHQDLLEDEDALLE